MTVSRTLGQQVYEGLAALGVSDSARAVQALALYAHRTHLTHAQLVHVLAHFAPCAWDKTTVAAADRLLTDRGETPDVGALHSEVADRWPAAGRWPADDPDRSADPEAAARARLAEAALAETCGPDRADRPPSAGEAARARLAEVALAETSGTGSDGEDQAATQPDPWVGGGSTVSIHAWVQRLRAQWADQISRVVLSDPELHLSIHLEPAQARAIGRELIAAADAGEVAVAFGEPER